MLVSRVYMEHQTQPQAGAVSQFGLGSPRSNWDTSPKVKNDQARMLRAVGLPHTDRQTGDDEAG